MNSKLFTAVLGIQPQRVDNFGEGDPSASCNKLDHTSSTLLGLKQQLSQKRGGCITGYATGLHWLHTGLRNRKTNSVVSSSLQLFLKLKLTA